MYLAVIQPRKWWVTTNRFLVQGANQHTTFTYFLMAPEWRHFIGSWAIQQFFCEWEGIKDSFSMSVSRVTILVAKRYGKFVCHFVSEKQNLRRVYHRIFQIKLKYFHRQNRSVGIIGWTLPIEVLSEFLCRTEWGSDESWKELVKMVR